MRDALVRAAVAAGDHLGALTVAAGSYSVFSPKNVATGLALKFSIAA